MIQRNSLLLLLAGATWVATSASATTWAYVAHYPWTYSFADGWFYQPPVQKVWQNGAWVPSPLGEPFDLAEVFDVPLTTFVGTDGGTLRFRLTISAEYPHWGLLALGSRPRVRTEPLEAAVDDPIAAGFLDPVGLDDLPPPEPDAAFDAIYLVALRTRVDDVLGQASIYFESARPHLSWADRGAIHGSLDLSFRSLDGGRFTLVGSLDPDHGLDGARGAFRALVHSLPPPPSEPPPGF